ncbi:hypothetical protein TNCV_4701011 [Trichonephila clavipes]|nr:hypothetical protein TNCV_4701011 [Trichonephila clavipes]
MDELSEHQPLYTDGHQWSQDSNLQHSSHNSQKTQGTNFSVNIVQYVMCNCKTVFFLFDRQKPGNKLHEQKLH